MNSNTNMSPIALFQHQLEMTLLLLVSLSPRMSTNDIIMAKVRLTEAGAALDRLLTDRNAANTSGELELALPLSFTWFLAEWMVSFAIMLKMHFPQRLPKVLLRAAPLLVASVFSEMLPTRELAALSLAPLPAVTPSSTLPPRNMSKMDQEWSSKLRTMRISQAVLLANRKLSPFPVTTTLADHAGLFQ